VVIGSGHFFFAAVKLVIKEKVKMQVRSAVELWLLNHKASEKSP